MRYRFLFTMLLVLILHSFSLGSAGNLKNESMEISISCNDSSYYPLLPIELCIEAKNIGNNTLYYNGHFDQLVEMLNVQNSKLLKYYCIRTSEYFGVCSLLVNESYSTCANLTSLYQIAEPGYYSCDLVLNDEVKSNQLSFRVLTPIGEDSLAWIMFRDAKKLVFAGGDASVNRLKAYSMFLEIVDKYPESIYAPYALRDAFFRSIIMDRQTVQDKSKEFIEAGFTGQLLDICLESIVATSVMLDDRAGGEIYLQSIIEQNPNSTKADRARYWLNDLRERPERR